MYGAGADSPLAAFPERGMALRSIRDAVKVTNQGSGIPHLLGRRNPHAEYQAKKCSAKEHQESSRRREKEKDHFAFAQVSADCAGKTGSHDGAEETRQIVGPFRHLASGHATLRPSLRRWLSIIFLNASAFFGANPAWSLSK
jgi:hypothetical protein